MYFYFGFLKGLITIILFEEVFTEELSREVMNKTFVEELVKLCNEGPNSFERYKLEYLQIASDCLNNGNYNGGTYNIFMIYEPKLRIIMSLSIRDRVVDHYVARYILLPKIIYS